MAETTKPAATPEQPSSSAVPDVKPSQVKPKSVPRSGQPVQPQTKPRRCDALNAIRVDRVYSGTDRLGLGEFLHRLVAWGQRTGHKPNPDKPDEELVHLNESLLEPLRKWLETEAPADFVVEVRGAYIGPDEARPIATADEATIESVDSASLVPTPFSGLSDANVLDLRSADFMVSIGDPGNAPQQQ